MITHERRRRAHNYGAWINNPIDKSPTAPTAATGDSSTDAQKTLKNRGSEKVEGMLRVQCDRAGGRRRPIPISWEQRREGQEEGENEYKLLFGSVPSYPSPLHLFPSQSPHGIQPSAFSSTPSQSSRACGQLVILGFRRR